MRGDTSSLPSERYVFEQMGLTTRHLVRSEEELMREAERRGGGCVPEGIWRHPHLSDKRVSVEVKRISGNTLPVHNNPDGRRRILRRGKIVWPWQSTVQCAVGKASSFSVLQYRVDIHYAVFLIPDTMSEAEKGRTRRHIVGAAVEAVSSLQPGAAKIRVVVMEGPVFLFDRF
tara:strand:- start:1 stop:519 length:519 start_codon:yes stop_codon:yes gene_type:complete